MICEERTLSRGQIAMLRRYAKHAPLSEPLRKTSDAVGLRSCSTTHTNRQKLLRLGLITVEGSGGYTQHVTVGITPKGRKVLGWY